VSHGSSEEPDLTAMLDVVMQLLMYFIMCVKFSADEVPTGTIALPVSDQAKPIMRGEDDILFLNLNPKGEIVVFGQAEPMDSNGATFKLWLGNRAMDAKSKSPTGKLDKVYIVLRADRGTSYSDVYRVLQEFKKQGFTKFRVRANTGGG
jgi:biopolymer transport protein ExbD